jgi:hypothetical protein
MFFIWHVYFFFFFFVQSYISRIIQLKKVLIEFSLGWMMVTPKLLLMMQIIGFIQKEHCLTTNKSLIQIMVIGPCQYISLWKIEP